MSKFADSLRNAMNSDYVKYPLLGSLTGAGLGATTGVATGGDKDEIIRNALIGAALGGSIPAVTELVRPGIFGESPNDVAAGYDESDIVSSVGSGFANPLMTGPVGALAGYNLMGKMVNDTRARSAVANAILGNKVYTESDKGPKSFNFAENLNKAKYKNIMQSARKAISEPPVSPLGQALNKLISNVGARTGVAVNYLSNKSNFLNRLFSSLNLGKGGANTPQTIGALQRGSALVSYLAGLRESIKNTPAKHKNKAQYKTMFNFERDLTDALQAAKQHKSMKASRGTKIVGGLGGLLTALMMSDAFRNAQERRLDKFTGAKKWLGLI